MARGGSDGVNISLNGIQVAKSHPALNLVEGAGVTITVVVDGEGQLADVILTSTASGGVTDHSLLTNVTADQHHAESHADTKHTTHPAHTDLSGVSANQHHTAFVQSDHDALANPHHSNANDHAQSHTHASHTAVGADDHHTQLHHAAHEPGGGDAMTVDASSSSGSLRTLGTGSSQAAAGNHSHAGGTQTNRFAYFAS